MDNYDTLVTALSDTAAWCGWSEPSSGIVQLEFLGAQVHFKATGASELASSRLVLRFGDVSLLSFLERKVTAAPQGDQGSAAVTEHRPHGQKAVKLTSDRFVLNDKVRYDELLAMAEREQVHFRSEAGLPTLQCLFWAGNLGLRIEAGSICLVTPSGEADIKTIKTLHGDWWVYWNEYWQKRGTPEALPVDPVCEVTVPLTYD